MKLRRLDDFNFKRKKTLIRVDVNVPVANGIVTDRTRLKRIVPTIQEILKKEGKPILLSHFGRPENKYDSSFSTKQVITALIDVLQSPVHHADNCIGPAAKDAIENLPMGHVLLLENTRFHPGEKSNDPKFAAELAALGDIFVSDSFSVAHRAHASVEGIAHLLPSCAGRLMENEISHLQSTLASPKHPVMAIIGGSKVSSKLELLENLIISMDKIIIGGGMANTFLCAQGYHVGRSLCEYNMIDTARRILAKAKAENCEIILPIDIVTAKKNARHEKCQTVHIEACPNDEMILDAGPASSDLFTNHIKDAKTIIWNGPLGAFETEPFNAATDSVARSVAQHTTTGNLLSIAGGGDTIAALNKSNSADKFTYISTAGGAFLEWLEGKKLPGVKVLMTDN